MFRVQKLLSSYGYCSRRKAEDLIKAGRVKVNGKVIRIGDKATEEDKISVDNKLVRKPARVYLMFHKPVGCVTALTDSRYRTIMDYIRIKERVYPVGRLDYNTAGLLLLTNDGDFANKVMHPRYEVKKTYLAALDRPINDSKIKLIEKGVELEDGLTTPSKVRKINEKLVEITIHEGKKRIVRRIMASLGYKVLFLNRTRIGKLNMGDLAPRKYRRLTKRELELVFR